MGSGGTTVGKKTTTRARIQLLAAKEWETTMAEPGTLHDAFIDELRDAYDAEKQLTKALPKMARAASSPDLRAAFEHHLEETRGQIERLEQVFESLDEKVRGKHCDGIAGIIEEGNNVMQEDFDEDTMDACPVSYTHLRAHETPEHLVCRL